MFELYASMHSQFYLTVERLYFSYVVDLHDICIYGESIDIFSGMIVFYHKSIIVDYVIVIQMA